MSAPALPRLDGAALWHELSPEQQAAIGAAAIELVGGWLCDDELGEQLFEGASMSPPFKGPWTRAAAHFNGVEELNDALDRDVTAAVGRQAFFDGETPRLPSLYGRICRACGCSDHDACQPACSWLGPDLCSACVAPEAADG